MRFIGEPPGQILVVVRGTSATSSADLQGLHAVLRGFVRIQSVTRESPTEEITWGKCATFLNDSR